MQHICVSSALYDTSDDRQLVSQEVNISTNIMTYQSNPLQAIIIDKNWKGGKGHMDAAR